MLTKPKYEEKIIENTSNIGNYNILDTEWNQYSM